MKHCLFVQWKKPTDASKFVIDGKYSEYAGTDIQDKIMKILSDIQKGIITQGRSKQAFS